MSRGPMRAGWAAPLLVAGLGATAHAQVAPYQVITEVVPYVGLGAGAVEMSPGLGDATTRAIMLPFDLTLYGETFSTVYVNPNGLVNVTSSRSGLNFPAFSIPSSVAPNGFIAPLWDDWCSSVAGCAGGVNPGVGVYYEIDDQLPGRGRLTIEWRRVRHFSDTQAPSDVSFKMTWYEGLASQVEFHYGRATPGVDFIGQPTEMEARIGIESAAGDRGMWISPCAGPAACTTPEVGRLEDTRITLVADAGEDVTITSVSAPEVGYPGLPMPVSAQLSSRHGMPLGPLTWSAYLLDVAATSTAGATALFTSAPLTLSGFESRRIELDLEVPADLPRGQYRVALVADAGHAITETDEVNNIAWAASSVRIADRAPDFSVLALTPASTSLRPGQAVDVDYRVDNRGNEPGELVMQLYLSRNRAITTADLNLGAPLRFDTTSREVVSGTTRVTLPADLQTGPYYLGVLLDPELAVSELDEANNVGRIDAPLIVASNQVEILTESLPAASLGRPYSVKLASAGGTGQYAYEITAGYRPRGMDFDEESGELYGVPLQPTTVDITFRVSSGAARGSKTLTLAVLEPDLPLTLVTQGLPDASLGADYAARLYAAGGTWPYDWSVASGSLPPGLGLARGGDIVGTPSRAGSFPVELRARDLTGASVTSTVTLTVRPTPNLSIITRDLPAATIGVGYQHTLFASGGIRPLTWSRVTVPPPGLIVTPEGRVQGAPEEVGRFRFEVRVIDAVGSVDTNELTLEVKDEGRFDLLTEALPRGQPGADYRAVVRVSGGASPYAWTVVRTEGQLPPGFEMGPGAGVMDGETPDDLVIEGRLEREGAWPFTLRVADSRGRTAERAYAVVSRVPPPEPPPVEEGGCTCARTRGAARGGLGLFAGGLLLLIASRRKRNAR